MLFRAYSQREIRAAKKLLDILHFHYMDGRSFNIFFVADYFVYFLLARLNQNTLQARFFDWNLILKLLLSAYFHDF